MLTSSLLSYWLIFRIHKLSANKRADMEFCIIIPRAKIGSLSASAKCSGFLATIYNINSSNQLNLAFKVIIWGNYATFCGIILKNLFSQPSFEEFHNMPEFFCEQCSCARSKFHVCRRVHESRLGWAMHKKLYYWQAPLTLSYVNNKLVSIGQVLPTGWTNKNNNTF